MGRGRAVSAATEARSEFDAPGDRAADAATTPSGVLFPLLLALLAFFLAIPSETSGPWISSRSVALRWNFTPFFCHSTICVWACSMAAESASVDRACGFLREVVNSAIC